jgi:hypothetical protein
MLCSADRRCRTGSACPHHKEPAVRVPDQLLPNRTIDDHASPYHLVANADRRQRPSNIEEQGRNLVRVEKWI